MKTYLFMVMILILGFSVTLQIIDSDHVDRLNKFIMVGYGMGLIALTFKISRKVLGPGVFADYMVMGVSLGCLVGVFVIYVLGF